MTIGVDLESGTTISVDAEENEASELESAIREAIEDSGADFEEYDPEDLPRIEIAVLNRDASSQMTAELAKTLQSLKSPDSDRYRVNVSFSYLQPVDANRNKIVKNFLDDPRNEWLLMVDNDIVPQTDILQMVDYDEPVVSGTTCILKKQVPQPVILKEEGDSYRQVNIAEFEDEVDDRGMIEVEGVGTGCLLIHRDVLETVEPPWFRFQYTELGDMKLGEDFYFSRKLRKEGIPMYVSTEHLCSHFKTTDLLAFADAVGRVQDFDEDVDGVDRSS